MNINSSEIDMNFWKKAKLSPDDLKTNLTKTYSLRIVDPDGRLLRSDFALDPFVLPVIPCSHIRSDPERYASRMSSSGLVRYPGPRQMARNVSSRLLPPVGNETSSHSPFIRKCLPPNGKRRTFLPPNPPLLRPQADSPRHSGVGITEESPPLSLDSSMGISRECRHHGTSTLQVRAEKQARCTARRERMLSYIHDHVQRFNNSESRLGIHDIERPNTTNKWRLRWFRKYIDLVQADLVEMCAGKLVLLQEN